MKVKIFKVYWCKCENAEHPHKRIKKPELHGKGSFRAYVWEIESVIQIDRSGGEIPNYCCEKMMEAIDGDFITFGHPEYRLDKEATSLSITKQEHYQAWGIEIMAIQFCPFCGEEIEYEECGDYEQK